MRAGHLGCRFGSAWPPASLSFVVGCDMKLYSVLLGWTGTDQALRVAAGFHGSMRLTGRGLRPLLSGVWSLPGNVANLAASSWGSARVGGYGQTIKRSKAS